MKKIILGLTILLSLNVFAGPNRELDGATITNGSAVLTLPTTTDTLMGRATTDTLTNKTLTAPVLSGTLTGTYTLGGTPTVPASAISSGTVSVANGGTGSSTLTLNGILYGNGTSAVGITSAGSQYQVYQAGASGVPTVGALQLGQSAAITGTLPIGNGGTGQTTANTAFNALAPSQSTHSGKFLTTNGTDTSWATIPASSPTVTGSQASPTAITAVGGISFSGTNYFNIIFIAGDSGAIDITANPQITAATNVGQQLVIISTSAVNTVKLEHGTGLLLNGSWIGGDNSAITLVWDGSNWTEISRR